MEIGPTGKYPKGKMNNDDKGELAIGIAHDPKTGNVVINFGTPVEWIAMGPPEAIEFARRIVYYAMR